ncbi:MAG: dephospho-CoA kinase [Methylophilaceae bacterium]|nr:dephospho-CoA kinase [Methylophilaceae bacterium]
MHIIGLTGGIGSGKSIASEIFDNLGVPIVDLDKINKKITQKNSIGYKEIIKNWGDLYLDKSMNIDRKKLQSDIFTKSQCKRKIEEILHPLIYKDVVRQIDEVSNAAYIIIVIPLLFETTTYQKLINESLLIDCSEDLQLERIRTRDGIPDELAKKIIKAQMSRNDKIKKANNVIKNISSKKILKENILYYHKNILEKLNEKLL